MSHQQPRTLVWLIPGRFRCASFRLGANSHSTWCAVVDLKAHRARCSGDLGDNGIACNESVTMAGSPGHCPSARCSLAYWTHVCGLSAAITPDHDRRSCWSGDQVSSRRQPVTRHDETSCRNRALSPRRRGTSHLMTSAETRRVAEGTVGADLTPRLAAS